MHSRTVNPNAKPDWCHILKKRASKTSKSTCSTPASDHRRLHRSTEPVRPFPARGRPRRKPLRGRGDGRPTPMAARSKHPPAMAALSRNAAQAARPMSTPPEWRRTSVRARTAAGLVHPSGAQSGLHRSRCSRSVSASTPSILRAKRVLCQRHLGQSEYAARGGPRVTSVSGNAVAATKRVALPPWIGLHAPRSPWALTRMAKGSP